MKHTIIPFLMIFSTFILFVLPSCSQQIVPDSLYGDCFDQRETVAKLTDQYGSVMQVSADIWVLATDGDAGSRYIVCSIPDSLRQPSLPVIFSGLVKKIEPYERLAGTPLKLTALKSRS